MKHADTNIVTKSLKVTSTAECCVSWRYTGLRAENAALSQIACILVFAFLLSNCVALGCHMPSLCLFLFTKGNNIPHFRGEGESVGCQL